MTDMCHRRAFTYPITIYYTHGFKARRTVTLLHSHVLDDHLKTVKNRAATMISQKHEGGKEH